MSKFKLPLLLTFVAAAVFASYLGKARMKRSSNSPPASPPQANSQQPLSFDSQHCRFESDHGPAEAYLNQGQIYLVVHAANSEEYYLMKDSCLFSWQEGYSTGTKFCYPLSTSSPASGFYLFPDSENPAANLDCQTEDFSDSLFLLPSEIIFSEVSTPAN